MAVTQTAVITYPRDPFLVSSLHSEILSTALIELFGDQAARLLSWINGLVILLIGLALGQELGLTPRAQLWFLALMLTSTAFVDLMGDGKIELISTAPLLAGVYWVHRSLKMPRKRCFALAGFLFGFAMIARPYNLFLAPVFVIAFVSIHVVARRRNGDLDLRRLLPPALWMLPPLLVMGIFHLLQNWLWLRNPLAPLVASGQLTASSWQWQFDTKLLNAYRLLYPFVVSFSNSPQSLGNISPFFIGFLPFLLMKKVRAALQERPALLQLGLAGLATLLVWLALFFTVVEIRYVLFLWVIFFLLISHTMDRAAEYSKLTAGLLLGPLFALALAYTGARTFVIALATYAPIDRIGQARCYGLELCTFLDPLNQSAAPGERVFVVNAYRYYLRPDLFACSSRAEEYGRLASLAQQDSPDFWVELYRRGFSYVTYEANYANFHTHFGPLPQTQGAPSWLRITDISPVTSGRYGLTSIYRIQAIDPPMTPGTQCEMDSAGIWQIAPDTPLDQK